MRWRLYILFLSATAAFCFMLLTAVTDYGNRGQYQPAMVSAARDTAVRGETGSTRQSARIVPQAIAHTPTLPTPKPTQLFVAANADPIMAKHEAELDERTNRGKPSHRNRLKYDDNGWFREEVALVTAYCPCPKCCGTQSPGITSIGKNAWTPGLAADPLYLEYGTRVFVPGYGVSMIDDTGGAMRRHWRQNGLLHIDVRMTYHYEARQWGSQYLRVKIYDES